ncbi:MAG: biotin--[acetyl-CoA-carboxylase] ligase [Rubrivivax sp.]|nr:biotin--[acetyl-CoA-carboxylase] ligase [Rubrivivax sp.]
MLPVLAWDTEALQRQLEPHLPGVGVQVLPRCGSTNTALLEDARQARGAFAPRLLVAEQQTAGRGRLGRQWVSEAGASLTFSLALALARPDWSGLSLAVGLAVAEALDESATSAPPADAADRPGAAQWLSGRIGLKWPNDLWWRGPPATGPDVPMPGAGNCALPAGRKLGGILVETVVAGPQRVAVVGIGLNIRPLPAERAAALGRELACLQEREAGITAPLALARVAVPLAQALRRFEREGFAAFAAGYARRDVLRGHEVATTDAAAPAGTAEGVADDGALLVRCGGQRHRIVSGEVSVRPAGACAGAPPGGPGALGALGGLGASGRGHA